MPRSYSIVLYLEGEARDAVREIQRELTKRTGSRKCIDSWMPHLTTGSGVVVDDSRQADIDAQLEQLAKTLKSFPLTIEGFNGTTTWSGARAGITTANVLWIDVVVNEKLKDLFLAIKRITDQYPVFYPRIENYVPHVTVAYGDLTREGYAIGEAYVQSLSFSRTIPVNHITLVENFPDKDVEYKRFWF